VDTFQRRKGRDGTSKNSRYDELQKAQIRIGGKEGTRRTSMSELQVLYVIFNQEYGTILFCSLVLLCSSICTLASMLSTLDSNLLDNNLAFDFSGTELKAEYS